MTTRGRTAPLAALAAVLAVTSGCAASAAEVFASAAPTSALGAATTSVAPITGTAAPAEPGASPSLPAAPLAGRVIVIDPGHNGRYDAAYDAAPVPSGHGTTKACNTAGTTSADGYPEHAANWAQALALRAALEADGATVVLTRLDDDGLGPCVNERAQVANDARADLLISLHADGNPDAGARGFHVIHSTTMEGGAAVEAASAVLATRVRDALAGTSMPLSTYVGEGTALSPRTDLATLNLLQATPGVMIELGNMRSPQDAAILVSPDFRAGVAAALVRAVRAQLG